MSTPSNPGKRWFYVREGRRQGPVDTERLVDLVLNGEVAEDALVWHSGLPEWLRAREVEEIRSELPPPVPTPSTAPPKEPVRSEVDGGEEAAPQDEPPGHEDNGPYPEFPGAAPADDEKRRRRRKHRHRESKRRPAWFWPLVAILAGLMVFLWWLLRRMNEVPPGRIIQTGSLSALVVDEPAQGPTVGGLELAKARASRPG
ncbi:MAG TPA: DUF4339 domain-containing protein [Vicinamibacteria bacterium]